jgi:hypothetical protein
MNLTNAHKLLLLSSAADDPEMNGLAPPWLVAECAALGLVQWIGETGAWRLTPVGLATQKALIGGEPVNGPVTDADGGVAA